EGDREQELACAEGLDHLEDGYPGGRDPADDGVVHQLLPWKDTRKADEERQGEEHPSAPEQGASPAGSRRPASRRDLQRNARHACLLALLRFLALDEQHAFPLVFDHRTAAHLDGAVFSLELCFVRRLEPASADDPGTRLTLRPALE